MTFLRYALLLAIPLGLAYLLFQGISDSLGDTWLFGEAITSLKDAVAGVGNAILRLISKLF